MPTTLSRGPYQHGKGLYEETPAGKLASSSQTNVTDTEFNRELHLKYWRRCFKSLLPTAYQSNDSTRMTLAFFTLSALDLLGEGVDRLSLRERKGYKDWVLSCEHPITGGFCGSPNHRLPDNVVKSGKGTFEPASMTATFFAMLNLNFVGSVAHANRKNMWSWLKKLQRKDGSFGEMVTDNGEIYGSRDMRICLCAAAVRWIIKLDNSIPVEDDIDVDALVKHIVNSEAYDGAIGETSQLESHAGYTYCAIAALSYLDRLPSSIVNPWTSPPDSYKMRGLTKLDETIRWCMLRQVTVLDEDTDDDNASVEGSEKESESAAAAKQKAKDDLAEAATNLRALTRDHKQYIGCNGRLNKEPDTCYSFWVGASLDMMGQNVLIDRDGTRRWLMRKTQHMIGGFGKMPGYPPDIYHSYMGLAALSVLNTTGLLPLDSALCISQSSKAKIEADMARICQPRAYPRMFKEYVRVEPDEEEEKDPEKGSSKGSAKDSDGGESDVKGSDGKGSKRK